MLTIFVSHAHQDNQWCRPFIETLKNRGLDVWYDEKGLQGGADWLKTIEYELESREIFLIVLTPDAWRSEWVQRELRLAFTTNRKIIPLLLRPTDVTGFIRSIQWVNVIGENSVIAAQRVIDVLLPPSFAPFPGQPAYASLQSDSPLAAHSVNPFEKVFKSFKALQSHPRLFVLMCYVLAISTWFVADLHPFTNIEPPDFFAGVCEIIAILSPYVLGHYLAYRSMLLSSKLAFNKKIRIILTCTILAVVSAALPFIYFNYFYNQYFLSPDFFHFFASDLSYLSYELSLLIFPIIYGLVLGTVGVVVGKFFAQRKLQQNRG